MGISKKSWTGTAKETTSGTAITVPTKYLPTKTISRNRDTRLYYVPYSVVEKWILHFTADGKLLDLDSNWVGLFAQPNLSPPTPAYSTLLPFSGYAPTIKFV